MIFFIEVGPHVFEKSGRQTHTQTDRQTDRQTRQLYIYRYSLSQEKANPRRFIDNLCYNQNMPIKLVLPDLSVTHAMPHKCMEFFSINTQNKSARGIFGKKLVNILLYAI